MSILPLQLREVTVVRSGRRILGPVSLTIADSGLTVVLGPNGAGKSTLLRAMHGVERTSGGQVAWAGGRDMVELRQSFVFQTPIVLRRSVQENIAYPLLIRGTPKREAWDKAADWAARVGLEAALDRPAPVLSGGERQKLALARALITEPEIVFLDEPTANLDGRSMREIESILTAALDTGTRLVMATHNLGQARRLGTDIVFLLKGEVHESAPSPAFFDQPQTEAAVAFTKGDIVE